MENSDDFVESGRSGVVESALGKIVQMEDAAAEVVISAAEHLSDRAEGTRVGDAMERGVAALERFEDRVEDSKIATAVNFAAERVGEKTGDAMVAGLDMLSDTKLGQKVWSWILKNR